MLDDNQIANAEEKLLMHKLLLRYYDLKPGNYSLVLEVAPNDHLCQVQHFDIEIKTTTTTSD